MEWRYSKVRPLALGMSALMIMGGISVTATAAGNDAQVRVVDDSAQEAVAIDLDSSEYNVNVNWTDESVSLGEIRLSEAPEPVTDTIDLGEVVTPNATAQSNSGGSGSTTTNTVDLSSNAITVGLLNRAGNQLMPSSTDSYAYTGNLISVSPLTVTDTIHNYQLVAGRDYEQTGDSSQTDAGEYRVTITGTGTANSNGYTYTGSRTITWKIVNTSSNTSNSGGSNPSSGASNSSSGASNTSNAAGTASGSRPVINGLTDRSSYCESVTFTVTDTDLDFVTNNGATMTASANGTYTITGDDVNHQIIAQDRAGNRAEVAVVVYRSHDYRDSKRQYTYSLSSVDKTAMTCSHCGQMGNYADYKDRDNKTVTTVPREGNTKNEKTIGRNTSGSGAYEAKVITSAQSSAPIEIGSTVTAQLAEAVATQAEKAAVSRGQTLTLTLEAVDVGSINSKVYNAAKSAESSNRLTIASYYDITLFKQLNNGERSLVRDTGSTQVEVTITIPANARGVSGDYRIIQVHDRSDSENYTTTVLTPILPSGSTAANATRLTFRTNRFSTFALAYTGNATGSTSTTSSNTVSGNSVSGNSSATSTTDNVVSGSMDSSSGTNVRRGPTGDDFWQSMGVHLTILLVAAIGLIYCGTVIYRSRKK